MRVFTITLFLFLHQFFTHGGLYSQSIEIQSPLDIPLLLSGNFGELRSTHFHAGIDLKTNGKIGQPVRSIAPGYVSRIKVQAGGYGRALYVTHLNGYTSVYGHLNSYYPEIEKYVKQEQYRKKSFEVDIYLENNKFIVTRGMQIGISGNTGRSGGPHLHLEYRDQNQVPMNLLLYDLPIKDTIPPQIRKLYLYDNISSETFQWQNKYAFPVSVDVGNYSVRKTIEGTSQVAFGIEVYDYLNGSANRCGIYTLDFFVDDNLIFSNQIDKVSFNEARYIRTYSDYEEKKLNKRSVHRLCTEPNNNLSIYKEVINNGLIYVNDTLVHQGLIIVKDASGNESELSFNFTLKTSDLPTFADTGNVKFKFNQENVFENESVRFVVSKNALYADKWFDFSNSKAKNDDISNTYILGNELIPMHHYPELSIKPAGALGGVRPDKLVIVKLETDGEVTSEGGRWNNGWVTAKVSGFGKYTLKVDSISPIISPVSFREGWYSDGDILSFRIKDDLSGIKTYNGYVNDTWVLFEYDAKSDIIFYKIDPEKLIRSKTPHSLKIYVMDERNNIQSFSSQFYY